MKLSVALSEAAGSRRERLVLESRQGESLDHLALKLLAYLLYGPDLAIERAVGQRHKPDLARVDTEGVVRLWIDCGQIEPRRLGRIASVNRAARILVLKRTVREAALYEKAARKALPEHAAGRVVFLGFDPAFWSGFLEGLLAQNTLTYEIDENRLCATLNGTMLETALSDRPQG